MYGNENNMFICLYDDELTIARQSVISQLYLTLGCILRIMDTEQDSNTAAHKKEMLGWLQSQRKPSWEPPERFAKPLGSVLYLIIYVSFALVIIMSFMGQIPWMVAAPFALNFVFNYAWPSIQFGMRSNLLSTIDLAVVVGTLIWALIAIWPYAPWVTIVNLPYLFWSVFSVVLQATITVMNWGGSHPKKRRTA